MGEGRLGYRRKKYFIGDIEVLSAKFYFYRRNRTLYRRPANKLIVPNQKTACSHVSQTAGCIQLYKCA
jgi:hypothetical protein